MQLKLLRQVFTDRSTIGRLFVDGEFECHTLEDVVRPEKVFGETAIPAGSYQVVISMSDRFKTRLPLLVDVPGYTGVRIHPGNTAADTLGCILVGQSRATDSIGASRAAFGVLMPKLEAAAAREKIAIEIIEERSESAAAPATRGRRVAVAPASPAAGSAPAVPKPAAPRSRPAKAPASRAAKPARKAAAAKKVAKAAPKAGRAKTRAKK